MRTSRSRSGRRSECGALRCALGIIKRVASEWIRRDTAEETLRYARRTHTPETRPSAFGAGGKALPRLIQLGGDLVAQCGGPQDLDVGQEALDPRLQLEAGSDAHAQDDRAVGPVLQLLALVPYPLADVGGHRGLDEDLHRLRLAAGDAERPPSVLGDVEVRGHLEALLQHLDLLDALHGERPDLAVFVGARVEVQPPVVVDEPIGIDGVALGPAAVEREVRDLRLLLVEGGVDEGRDDVLLARVVLPRIRPRREQLLDTLEVGQAARGKRLSYLRESRLEVLRERRSPEERHQVLAEVERGQLGEGEGLGQALLVAFDEPPDLAAVGALVVERETRLLTRLEVTPDRALGDAVLVGQVLRGRVAPRFDPLQDLPLPNHFGISHLRRARGRGGAPP